jgi:hypothetical protein
MCGDNENVTKGFPEWFIGVLAKLQKEAIGFIMSICPSIHMEHLDSHWTDLHEIWYLSIF